MSTPQPHDQRHLNVLLLDDDQAFLDTVAPLLESISNGEWEVFAARDSATALNRFNQGKVDLAVIDIHMPTVDGLQFIKLLHRKFPAVTKVVLTGDSDPVMQEAAVAAGAELYLEKPRSAGGWQAVQAMLAEVARLQATQGFRGIIQQAGLDDVLQMECLGRRSSVIEVSLGGLEGQVYLLEGDIVHSEVGKLSGPDAFYFLLSQSGGGFSVKPYRPPAARTIKGAWEFLIMEAARKRDEGTEIEALAARVMPDPVAKPRPSAFGKAGRSMVPSPRELTEILAVSSLNEVLHDWECPDPEGSVGWLDGIAASVVSAERISGLGALKAMQVDSAKIRLNLMFEAGSVLMSCSAPSTQTATTKP